MVAYMLSLRNNEKATNNLNNYAPTAPDARFAVAGFQER
jgi:hypothetical protein